MEQKKYIACWPLLLIFALSPAAVMAEEATPGDGVVARHNKKSQDNYAAQDKLLSEARDLFAKKEYKPALEKTEEVLARLDLEVSEVNSEIARNRLVKVRRQARIIRHAWGQDLLMQARQLAADGKFNDAGNLAARVVGLATDVAEVPGMNGQIDAKLQDEANALMRECRNMEKNETLRSDVSLEKAQSKKYKEEQKQIARLLREAESLMRAKQYDSALTKVEQVFIFDPLNSDAMLLAGKLYQLFYKYGRERSRTDAENNLAYAQWQWAEPVFMRSSSAGSVRDGIVKESGNQRVYNKLNSIVYPEINWSEKEVDEALKYLTRRSKEYDPDKEGIEINYVASGGDKPVVTLNLTNMPLSEIIRYTCLLTGLEYRVDGNSILVSKNAASKMVDRKLQVSSKIFSDVREMEGSSAPDAGGNAGGGDDGGGNQSVGTSGASVANPNPEQWKNFFAKHLINMPEGSRISSDVRSSTLSIRTSSSCLRDIEELLSQQEMQEEKMVMIEIRAMEISETDSQELGFNWNLNMLGYNMDANGNISNKGSTGWLFRQGENTTNGSNDDTALSMIRGAAQITGLSNTAVVKDFNIFPALFGSRNWFGSDTPIDLRLTINALAQNQRVEALSAPKLLTVDGKQAEINVGKTYYFPDSWDTLEISSESTENSGGLYFYRITAPAPDINKDGTTLGVFMKVRPTVQPDNQTIRLELNPRISAFLGKDNADGRYDVNVYALGTDGSEVLYRSYPIWRARTSLRALELVVDVHDGEPIVVGGIIDNSSVNRTDKIPILGDLPLIGRFFQSQAENTKKQNLIMFVTARQIDFRGNPIKKNGNTGIPDFNR